MSDVSTMKTWSKASNMLTQRVISLVHTDGMLYFVITANLKSFRSHASFNDITREQLDSEIDNVDEALKKILGIVPKYVRPPYGTCDASCVDYLQAKGKTVVQWSEDSGMSDV